MYLKFFLKDFFKKIKFCKDKIIVISLIECVVFYIYLCISFFM